MAALGTFLALLAWWLLYVSLEKIPLPRWAKYLFAAIIFVAGSIVALKGLGESLQWFYGVFNMLHPRAHEWWRTAPYLSTAVVAGLCGALVAFIVALAWWSWASSPPTTTALDKPDAETAVNASLAWRPEANELKFAIVGETTETLRDVSVLVQDIRKRSEDGRFVQVRDLHEGGTFQEFSLSAGFRSEVYPDTPLVLRFLTMSRKLIEDDPVGDGIPGIWRFEEDHDDGWGAMVWKQMPSPGVWRVQFKGLNGLQLRDPCYLYFEWEGRGVTPTPWTPQRGADAESA